MPEDTEVLAYPDVIVNASCVQIAQPFAAYELTVCHQMVDGVLPGKTDEPVYEFNPLLGVGVTPLVHHLEHDIVRISHSAMSRWILRSEDPAAASLSNAAASLVYVTRCTLQRAHTIMLRALIRARFILFPKCSCKIGYNSLLFVVDLRSS